MWGCPAYVLDPKLQDGKKLPKWKPRARRGMFLGYIQKHSSLLGRVLIIVTGYISPQCHVVYDDLFSTVTTTALNREALDEGGFLEEHWHRIIENGYERDEVLDEGHPGWY